jgi:DNA (cytosine-5)-methyltransferase 1
MDRRRDNPRAYRAVDLFCGAGGLTAGFRDEGFDVALALDHDRDACATYELNFGDSGKILTRAIEELGDAEVRRLAGRVDVVLGGPSCQSFSTHGRRSGWVLGDPRSYLWSHMHRIVKALRPAAFCMENVPGMLYFNRGRFARRIFGAFEDLGYVVHKEILLVANYNVPQLRRRLFVVGVKKGLDFVFPEPARLGGWRRDTLELWEKQRIQRRLAPHLTVGEALHDLPESVFRSESEEGTYRSTPRRGSLAEYLRNGADVLTNHVAGCLSGNTATLVAHVPSGGNWRDIPPHLLPDRFRRMRRTDSTNLIGRLDLDRPAYTLTTQFDNVTTGCFLHPTQDRALSVREGARIQTFRDDFQFVGTRSSKCRQIGNAVPPLMARALARNLRAALEGNAPPPPLVVGSIDRDGVPAASSLETARRMARQRRHDTAPEMAVRRELQSRGHRYRVHQPVPGHRRRTIDIAFTRKKLAILVHGCFWHGCPEHSRPTKSNSKWWADKIAANRKRDKVTRSLLKGEGWTTVVVWEHEDPRDAADRIEAALQSTRSRSFSRM